MWDASSFLFLISFKTYIQTLNWHFFGWGWVWHLFHLNKGSYLAWHVSCGFDISMLRVTSHFWKENLEISGWKNEISIFLSEWEKIKDEIRLFIEIHHDWRKFFSPVDDVWWHLKKIWSRIWLKENSRLLSFNYIRQTHFFLLSLCFSPDCGFWYNISQKNSHLFVKTLWKLLKEEKISLFWPVQKIWDF